jgi:hypothetical protein
LSRIFEAKIEGKLPPILHPGHPAIRSLVTES